MEKESSEASLFRERLQPAVLEPFFAPCLFVFMRGGPLRLFFNSRIADLVD